MTDENRNARAQLLHSYHDKAAPVLVLPNAWDAGSARVIAAAGARAIATTSGGVSWSLGRSDGQAIHHAELADVVRRIATTVEVPVTADIEAGYGPAPADVAATVRAVVSAGAAGVNLEDSQAPGGPLFPAEQQAQRLAAAREAATSAGVPDLFLNARTDVYLFQIGAPERRHDDVLDRAQAYAEAGADCLFVPGLLDLDELGRLVASSPLPVNAMAVPGGPTVAELGGVGVRRVSVGTWLAQEAYSHAHRLTAALLSTGRCDPTAGLLDYGVLNHLFTEADAVLPDR